MEYMTLNNGITCPVIGIGTFMLSPADAENSVREALKILVLLILCGCGAPTVQNAAVTEARGTSISEDNTPHMGRY